MNKLYVFFNTYALNFIFILLILVFLPIILSLYKKIHLKLQKKLGLTNFSENFGKVLISVISVFLIIISIPEIGKQTINILALIIGGLVTFSSSTIIANGMSGLMLKIIKPFKINDIIEFEDTAGRISEIGLFHTEFQTPARNLVTVPNHYLISKSFKILNYDGILVKSRLSLGYDIPRDTIEKLLITSAKKINLKNPHVFVRSLDDFSITYEIRGLLENPDEFFTCLSNLNKSILDEFNRNKVEIVSPSFMNTRAFDTKHKFISKPAGKIETSKDEQAEEMMFEKAITQTEIEKQKETIKKLSKAQAVLKEKMMSKEYNEKDEIKKEKIEESHEKIQNKINETQKLIDELEKKIL